MNHRSGGRKLPNIAKLESEEENESTLQTHKTSNILRSSSSLKKKKKVNNKQAPTITISKQSSVQFEQWNKGKHELKEKETWKMKWGDAREGGKEIKGRS